MATRRMIDMAVGNAESHSQGWPHYDRHGNCLCMNRCCFGDNGCRNRCACSGQSHGHEVGSKHGQRKSSALMVGKQPR